MKNKLIKLFLIFIALVALMYGEYRYIMTHQCPYVDEDTNTVYIEVFDQVDEYDLLHK